MNFSKDLVHNTRRRRAYAVATLVAVVGSTGIAHAQTGGAVPRDANKTPNTPAKSSTASKIDPKGVCPSAKQLEKRANITSTCSNLIMRTIYNAGYHDVNRRPRAMAYQSIANVRGGADGIVGANTVSSVLAGKGLNVKTPRSTQKRSKNLLIDKSEQVAILATRGEVHDIVRISTGSGKTYTEVGQISGLPQSGDSQTPTGNFKVISEYGADHGGDLGKMPYAHYYDDEGRAIHTGDVSVAFATHGCVRVDGPTMEGIMVPALKPGTRITIVP